MMKVLNVAFLVGVKWGYRLIQAAEEAFNVGKLSSSRPWKEDSLLYIGARLDGLMFSFSRLKGTIDKLLQEVDCIDEETIQECLVEGRAITTNDPSIRLEMMVHIHSFLFEIDACLEFVTHHVLIPLYADLKKWNHKETKKYITDILRENDINPNYIQELNKLRNHFTHQASAHIAVSIEDRDILVMKSNINNYDNPSDYFLLGRDLSELHSEFWKSLLVLEALIVEDLKG